jgi:hypothetical protein
MSVNRNLSPHESYNDEEPSEAGSDRAFGCTVGIVLMGIGALKVFLAGAPHPAACLIFGAGALLLLFGIAAPSRLSMLNRLWLKLGATIAKVVNPIVLAVLFFMVVTPMAFIVRMLGKQPLRLAPDRPAATYWINRDMPEGGVSSMKRQF